MGSVTPPRRVNAARAELRHEHERRALLARRLRDLVVLLRPGLHPGEERLASMIRFRVGWILTEYLHGD